MPQYKYASVNEYRTVLTDNEIKIFIGLLLHLNIISIGKAISLTKYKLQQNNQSFIPADFTFRRYTKWFKDNNYDKWILAISEKPAYLMQNEKIYKMLHNEFIPTIDETIKMIDMWLRFKTLNIAQTCLIKP